MLPVTVDPVVGFPESLTEVRLMESPPEIIPSVVGSQANAGSIPPNLNALVLLKLRPSAILSRFSPLSLALISKL